MWEKEHETDVAEHVEKGKFMKIAKYLNRLILVGGLELPLASRPVMELEKATSSMKECGCSRVGVIFTPRASGCDPFIVNHVLILWILAGASGCDPFIGNHILIPWILGLAN